MMTDAKYDAALKRFVENELQEYFITGINSFIDAGTKSRSLKERQKNAWFSNSSKLRSQSGKLADSFRMKQFMKVAANSDTKGVTSFSYNNGIVTGKFGTSLPYASIQEYGGEVKAVKKGSSVKRRKGVYIMEQFFWRVYYETKNIFWKILALTISKKGYIKIKARPYFFKSIDQINENLGKKMEIFLNNITTEYDKK